MRKERVLAILIAVVLVLFGCLYMSSIVGASDGLPEGIAEWTRSDGSICSANIVSGGIDCDCPCYQDCEENERQPTLTPTEEPQPTTTPQPEPTKAKCNSGRGNGSEGSPDCDPGNSGGHNEGGD